MRYRPEVQASWKAAALGQKLRTRYAGFQRPFTFCRLSKHADTTPGLASCSCLHTTSTTLNPLASRGNYSDTSNNMKWVHWPLMGGLLHLVQRAGDWAGPQPLLTVPNVTAHPSTASVPVTVLLYNGPLLCGFKMPTKG